MDERNNEVAVDSRIRETIMSIGDFSKDYGLVGLNRIGIQWLCSTSQFMFV